MIESWHDIVPEAEFPPEGKLVKMINGWHVLVVKTESGIYAVNDRCTHQASTLSGGRIRRGAVMCPLHGARFELDTGRNIGGTYRPIRTFPLRIVDGMVEVAVPEDSPGMEDLPVVL
jgi:nitrite reductase/ring-hydroxylating ferredoxin subunit